MPQLTYVYMDVSVRGRAPKALLAHAGADYSFEPYGFHNSVTDEAAPHAENHVMKMWLSDKVGFQKRVIKSLFTTNEGLSEGLQRSSSRVTPSRSPSRLSTKFVLSSPELKILVLSLANTDRKVSKSSKPQSFAAHSL